MRTSRACPIVLVGRAWEASREPGIKQVNCAVGLTSTSDALIARLARENEELREHNQTLEHRLDVLEAAVSRLVEGAAGSTSVRAVGRISTAE